MIRLKLGSVWAVAALVFNPDDDRILAINRPGAPTDLGLIGGHVEEGESPEAAVVRECREEAGIEVDGASLEWLYDRKDETVGKWVACFRVLRWTGTPESRESGLIVRWATQEELLAPGNTFRDWTDMAIAVAGLQAPGKEGAP